MVNQNTYSSVRFFTLCLVFVVLGAVSAASVTTFISPTVQRPSNFVLLTDKDTYYANETIIIYILNTLQETLNFKDDAYGLYFERWVNGKWEFLLSIGNFSRTTTLQPIDKAAVTYFLGEDFMEGKYRVISVGEISQNGETISVEANKEFDVVTKPPPQTVLLLLTVETDKPVYHQGDNITVILKNESNDTITFGDSSYSLFFEKWNGASWEFYTGVPGVEVITTLNPGERAEIIYWLGGRSDKPFPPGEYRAVSVGWAYLSGQIVQVGGFADFLVE